MKLLKKLIVALVIFALFLTGTSLSNYTVKPAKAYGTSLMRPVKIWTMCDVGIDEAIEQYRKKRPDVSFSVEVMDYETLKLRLVVAIAAHGDMPDIVLVNDNDIDYFYKVAPELFGRVKLKRDYDCAKLKVVSFCKDVYAIPYFNSPAAIYYRYDVAQLLGIDMDNIDLMTFFEIGRHLQDLDMNLFNLDYRVFETFLKSTGFRNLDSEGTLETMRMLKELINLDLVDPSDLTCDMFQIQEKCFAGQYFSVIGGIEWIIALEKAYENGYLPGEWRIAPLPKSEIFWNDVSLGGFSWMVLKNGYKLRSMDFLFSTLCGDPQYAIMIAENRLGVSHLKNAYNEYRNLPADPFLCGSDMTSPNGQNAAEVLFNINDSILPVKYAKYPQEIWDMLFQLMSESLLGNIEPEPYDAYHRFLDQFDIMGGRDYNKKIRPVPDGYYDDNYDPFGTGLSQIINSKLSGFQLGDDDRFELDEELKSEFEKHIYFTQDGKLVFEKDKLDLSDEYTKSAAEMVEFNISLMNEIVDEGLGTINEDKEIVIHEENEALANWRNWGFYLSFTKLGAKMNVNYTRIFTIICLAVHSLAKTTDIIDISKKLAEEDSLSLIIQNVNDLAFNEAEILASYLFDFIDLYEEIKDYFEILDMLYFGVKPIKDMDLEEELKNILLSLDPSTITGKILQKILEVLLPDFLDCAIVLYNASAYKMGCEVQLRWWPVNKFGTIIKSIEV